MTPEQELAWLDRLNRSTANAAPVGGPGSHWAGCEQVHPACQYLALATDRHR